MKFTTRTRRQAPTIIIISLIDILIVLLIFLMVTTSFKQQPALKLVLPESKQAKEGASDNAHKLVVTVARQEPHFYLGPLAMTLDHLQDELHASVARDPGISVSIWSDSGATLGEFIQAWDAARAAGIRNVEIRTKRPSTP